MELLFSIRGIMGDMGSLFVRLIVLFFTGSAIYLIVRKRGEITFSEFILSIGIPMSFSNIIFERFYYLDWLSVITHIKQYISNNVKKD